MAKIKGLEAFERLCKYAMPLRTNLTYEDIELVKKELKDKDELTQALSIATCENGDLLKYKKALDIIKEKQVDVRMFIIYDLENYNKLQKNDYCKLTKDEDDLLNEVLL